MVGLPRMGVDEEQLIQDLSQKDFIVFAGAGIVGTTGVRPSWKRLLERFEEEEPNAIDADLNQIREDGYPEIAQKIFNTLRKREGNDERYHEILKEGLHAKDAEYSSQELDIVDTAGRVITTNFNDSFECALNRVLEGHDGSIRVVQSLPNLVIRSLAEKYSVSYLHGRIDEKCVVFKEDDYKTFYPSLFGENDGCDNLEKFLRCAYEEYTLVFVGFSFTDRCFLKAPQEIHKTLERNDATAKGMMPGYRPVLGRICHYACLRKFDEESERNSLIKSGCSLEEAARIVDGRRKWNAELDMVLDSVRIKVMRYKEHIEWTQWFARIRDIRRRQGPQRRHKMLWSVRESERA